MDTRFFGKGRGAFGASEPPEQFGHFLALRLSVLPIQQGDAGPAGQKVVWQHSKLLPGGVGHFGLGVGQSRHQRHRQFGVQPLQKPDALLAIGVQGNPMGGAGHVGPAKLPEHPICHLGRHGPVGGQFAASDVDHAT